MNLIKMAIGKTLTDMVLASAIGLAGCSDNYLGRRFYESNIGDSTVVLYEKDDSAGNDGLEVTTAGVTWMYIDRDENGTIDYAQRTEGGKVTSFEPDSAITDPLQHDLLLKATETYTAMLSAINQQIGSEVESQHPAKLGSELECHSPIR